MRGLGEMKKKSCKMMKNSVGSLNETVPVPSHTQMTWAVRRDVHKIKSNWMTLHQEFFFTYTHTLCPVFIICFLVPPELNEPSWWFPTLNTTEDVLLLVSPVYLLLLLYPSHLFSLPYFHSTRTLRVILSNLPLSLLSYHSRS